MGVYMQPIAQKTFEIYSVWHPEWGEVLMTAQAFDSYFDKISPLEQQKCIVKRGAVEWHSMEMKRVFRTLGE